MGPGTQASCGPTAVSNILALYGNNTSRKTIAQSLIKNEDISGSFIRGFTSIFDEKGKDIFLLSELKYELNRRGFNAVVFTGTDKQCRSWIKAFDKAGYSGISLSWKRGTIDGHYEAFPPVSNVGKLYGSNAYITDIIIINPSKTRFPG